MTTEIMQRLENRLAEIEDRMARRFARIDSIVEEISQKIPGSKKTGRELFQVLSWDCGMKSSSWAHISFTEHGIDLLSCGTIDFLNGSLFDSVPKNDWPRRIRIGLENKAPKVPENTIVCIEIQPQTHRGCISSANAATQYCIAFWYSKNPIRFIHARCKNTLGPIWIKTLSKRYSDEALRKKHTRVNFDLFYALRYSKKIRGPSLRDVSDAFMQGLYFYNTFVRNRK